MLTDVHVQGHGAGCHFGEKWGVCAQGEAQETCSVHKKSHKKSDKKSDKKSHKKLTKSQTESHTKSQTKSTTHTGQRKTAYLVGDL